MVRCCKMSEDNSEIIVDVNVFDIIQKAYEEHFNRRKNKLGCSELPFCPRKIIISRLYNIPFENKMIMLHGKIHHAVIQQPNVLRELVKTLYQQLNIKNSKINVTTEKYLIHELLPGKFLEAHVDIDISDFLIEIKTTARPLKYWAKELSEYHVIQLNTYLGLTKKQLGFILLINLRAYFSDIIDFNDVWNKYGCFLPVKFNQELFENTLEKAKKMFILMKHGDFNIKGPVYEWECRYCPKQIQEICNKTKHAQSKI